MKLRKKVERLFLVTVQKMKFSIKDFFGKCDQIRRKLKKSLMENSIFCAVARPVTGGSLNMK